MQHAPGPQDDHSHDADLRIIRREVDAFLRTHRLRWSDSHDLVQDCMEHWLSVSGTHDAARASRTTFLKRVVANRLKDLFRAEQTHARIGQSRSMSLDEPRAEEDGMTLEDVLSSGGGDPASAATWHVTLDAIYGRLSERQRAIVKGVLDGYRMAELARELGVHRDTLYQDRKRIQEVFWQEGLAPPDFDPTDRPARS